jgi:phosphotransferase system HPr (HPr) family protein
VTDGACEGDFTVRRELGLHARPAGRFVALASRFASDIQVARCGAEDEWVSGRSVLSLLSLGATRGTRLRVRAVGVDAAEAVAALGSLLEEASEPEPARSREG